MDLVGALADPIAPAEPLLDTHRVPGEVIVYKDVAVLEVESLTSNLAGEEYLEFASSELRTDALPALLTPAAVLVPGRRRARTSAQTNSPSLQALSQGSEGFL